MSRVRQFWEIWKKFAHVIGDVVGRVLLTVFYAIVFAPVGLGVRLFGDPLGLKIQRRIEWNVRAKSSDNLERAKRLF